MHGTGQVICLLSLQCLCLERESLRMSDGTLFNSNSFTRYKWFSYHCPTGSSEACALSAKSPSMVTNIETMFRRWEGRTIIYFSENLAQAGLQARTTDSDNSKALRSNIHATSFFKLYMLLIQEVISIFILTKKQSAILLNLLISNNIVIFRHTYMGTVLTYLSLGHPDDTALLTQDS